MNKTQSFLTRIPYPVWLILIVLNLSLILIVVLPEIQNSAENKQALIITDTPTIAASLTDTPNQMQETPISLPVIQLDQTEKIFFLSLYRNNLNQIYVYQPGNLTFTRLFNTPYEEIHPRLSPDKAKLAYSAKKNGYWDIYIYDLVQKNEIRITDSAAFDGEPTWSPDSQNLAYSSYQDENFDIYIQSLSDLNQEPIQLTTNGGSDFSPSWSPSGREIAFVSTNSGEEEIWLAKLDTVENRFFNISNHPEISDRSPNWSPDGQTIYWSGDQDGYSWIYALNLHNTPNDIGQVIQGELPGSAGTELIILRSDANQQFLSIQNLETDDLATAPINLPGKVMGYDWIEISELSDAVLNEIQSHHVLQVSNPVEDQIIARNSSERISVDILENIESEYPYMNSEVIEPFNRLRSAAAYLAGWDFLHTLERAYLPITEPSDPGGVEEWLYTGRAFEFNPLSIYADLAVVVREQRNGNTFWRIYLKARYQDGSQGMPLMVMPWNLASRYDNDPAAYETGGFREEIPGGYWIDFTALAQDHGWQRLPALSNWRTFFAAARFNQFVYSDGLDWFSAMYQIYPLEALKTPTPLPTLTSTPTLTPTVRYFRSPTATLTPTQTNIPTRRPTWTPIP